MGRFPPAHGAYGHSECGMRIQWMWNAHQGQCVKFRGGSHLLDVSGAQCVWAPWAGECFPYNMTDCKINLMHASYMLLCSTISHPLQIDMNDQIVNLGTRDSWLSHSQFLFPIMAIIKISANCIWRAQVEVWRSYSHTLWNKIKWRPTSNAPHVHCRQIVPQSG